MRGILQIALSAMIVVGLVTPTAGLERIAARVTEADLDGDWSAGASCTTAYYNACTGWIWIWSGHAPGDRVGVLFDKCCPSSGLTGVRVFASTGAATGYGFTGTIDVWTPDPQGCPTGDPWATVPALPTWGWNDYVVHTKIPDTFLVTYAYASAPPFPDLTGFATDHPAIGPTGPEPCGTCFAADRPNRSFLFESGVAGCPGEPFHDGVCNAELLFEAKLLCNVVDSPEANWVPSSFGAIKALYR